MGDRVAFFYGTLMAPQVLYRVCYGSPHPTTAQRSLLKIRPSILHCYCRHKIRGCEYPCIVPSANSSVRGTLVEGLTDGDLWRLDLFEGDEYTRERVRVKVLLEIGDEKGNGNVEGEEIEAETYVWADDEERLEEGEWDFAAFRQEKLPRWIGGNGFYHEVDEAVRNNGKDPTGGRGASGSITEQLDARNADGALPSAV
ncbi:hypothetical protein G7Y79_00027g059780 [Physcia stellaris]|nr:hypothetical protein G7Y79_00027g059780 [Physcia stellaris]